MVLASGVLIATVLLLGPLMRGTPLSPGMAILAAMPLLIAGSLMLDAPALRCRQPGGALTSALGGVALALSWWGLLGVVGMLTEIWLVPWDTWGEPVRPPAGTWQRAVNDFFESGLGAHLPAIVLIGSSALVLLARLRAGSRLAYALWSVAAADLLVLVAELAMLPVVGIFHPSSPEQIGYGYTWPGILSLILSCVVLLALARPRGRSREAVHSRRAES